MLLGQNSKRNIRTHGSRCFDFVHGHGEDLVLYVFECITENLIELVSHLLCVNRDLLVRDLEFRQVQEAHCKPLTIRVLLGIVLLALFVRYEASLFRIDQKDTAGL